MIPPLAQVEYKCEGFLEKNRDTVHEVLIEILKESKVCEQSVITNFLNTPFSWNSFRADSKILVLLKEIVWIGWIH